MNKDLWIAFLLLLIALGCLPAVEHKPLIESMPTPKIIESVMPLASATPQKSACEFEVESLKSENDSLRQRPTEYYCDCDSYE